MNSMQIKRKTVSWLRNMTAYEGHGGFTSVQCEKKEFPILKGYIFNPLNAELNPICHLLALLGTHHIFHVSGLRVKLCFLCFWKVRVLSKILNSVK